MTKNHLQWNQNCLVQFHKFYIIFKTDCLISQLVRADVTLKHTIDYITQIWRDDPVAGLRRYRNNIIVENWRKDTHILTWTTQVKFKLYMMTSYLIVILFPLLRKNLLQQQSGKVIMSQFYVTTKEIFRLFL